MTIDDPEAHAAWIALDKRPSRERLAELVRRLARSAIDDTSISRILAGAADRVMTARAAVATRRAAIQLASARERDAFLKLPVAIRSGFEITAGAELTSWGDACPRCDREIRQRRESVGSRYEYNHWCESCGWSSTLDGGITLAEAYSLMAEAEREEKVQRLDVQATRDREVRDATCWPLRGVAFDSNAPYPEPIARLKFLDIEEVLVMGGKVEHVVMPASAFLQHADSLLERAPIRSATLLVSPDDHLTMILGSRHLQRLTGLGLDVPHSLAGTVIDALVTAPAMPHLRHLDTGSHRFSYKEILALAHAPVTASLQCFHLQEDDLTWDDDDYMSIKHWTDAGRLALLDAPRFPWFETFLGPLRRLIDRR